MIQPYANTITRQSTKFIAATELIRNAREEYNIVSENWPYPTEHYFGIPNDNYYAELWSDGMDWQTSYWLLEEEGIEKPQCKPFIIFEDHSIEEKFERWTFKDLIRASLFYRRDLVWIKQDPYSYYNDSVWPFIKPKKIDKPRYTEINMIYMEFSHASQVPVQFYMNKDYLPERAFEDRRPESRKINDALNKGLETFGEFLNKENINNE